MWKTLLEKSNDLNHTPLALNCSWGGSSGRGEQVLLTHVHTIVPNLNITVKASNFDS